MEMKLVASILLLAMVLELSPSVKRVEADGGAAKRRPCNSTDGVDDQWDSFTQRFNKTYNDCAEENMRRDLRRFSRRLISSHNADASKGLHSYVLGENDLSDRTDAEYKSLLSFRPSDVRGNGRRRRATTSPTVKIYYNSVAVSTLSASVNWTAQAGWVGPVVSQGPCGSCWAYSATGAIEAQLKNVTKATTITLLSQQNLIDCSGPQGNYGCNGGNPVRAYNYVALNGQQTLATYPCTSNTNGVNGTCKFSLSKSVVTVTGWYYVDTNEAALQQAIAKVGPISIAIDASSTNFRYYSSGIFSYASCSSTNLNHAVLAVGYGKDSTGKAYWLIKNSWGTSWGEKGYIRIARNANNMCGVASFATFPVVAKVATTGR